MPHTRLLFVTLALCALVLAGCGDRDPEPRAAVPPPPVAAASPRAAEVTGWPAGLGRALVVRLASGDQNYRLVVPELGDRRFADSAISLKPGDSIKVALFGRRGKAGDARLRIVDSEVGTGSCVTWPAAEVTGATYVRRASSAWRIAAERDSVSAVAVDSLAGMSQADSVALASAVTSLLASLPGGADSALHGIPFDTRRAYSFRAAGVEMIAAELVRRASSEADPREERVLAVGESEGGGSPTHRLVYSRRVSGRADSTAMTELLAVVITRQPGRPIIVFGVEEATGLRLHLLERVGRMRWRLSWSSVVSFC
ncbi:MAG: hypothetical protein ACR2GJ_02265 [Gemmatimonadaceae bacterium]